jgi:hypothetical protein
MNTSTIIWLKVILASILIYQESMAKQSSSEEYDLISTIVCGFTFEAVNEDLISWKKSPSYSSYDRINPKNRKSRLSTNLDLDEIFNDNQRNKIDRLINLDHPLKINPDSIYCKIDLKKISGFVAKKVIFSYSYPIISEGINGETYGLILESEVFEINYTLRLKLFINQKDTWKLIYAEDLAFS